MIKCPNCAMDNPDGATVCQHCQAPLVPTAATPVAAAPGKLEAIKQAKNALTMGIIGFFCFGIILGPLAIVNARKAKNVLVPGDEGYGNAQAGEIIGWIVTALYIIAIIYNVINAASGGYSY